MIDIQLPDPPNWTPLIIGIGLMTVFSLVALIIVWNRKTSNASTKTSPLQRLDSIELQWKNKQYSQRKCAYELASLLQQTLGINEIQTTPPPRLTEPAATQQWRMLVEWLNTSRYAPTVDLPVRQEIIIGCRIILKTLTENKEHAVT